MGRITVTPADEDEVIVAGVQAGPEERAPLPGQEDVAVSGGAGSSTHVQTDVSASTGAEDPEGVRMDAPDSAGGQQGATSDAGKPQGAGRGSRGGGKTDDAFQETTLDDLKPSPMPLAQRIVIVAAVVCIIGALVYYFLAMR